MEYYLRRAIDGIKASPAASGLAVASIAASVLFAGAVLLVTSNAYRAVARWAASGVDVSVYFRPEAAETDVVASRKRVEDDQAVVDIRFVSQEEAWQFVMQGVGGSDALMAGLTPEALPASLEIRLEKDLSDTEVTERVEAWKRLPGVSDIQSSRAAVVSGTTAADIVRWVSMAMGALALGASLLIVLPSFQLAAYTRRDEMNVLRLVGAVGPGYWGPVVLAGVLEGVAASVAALAVLLVVFEAVAMPIRQSLPTFADRVVFLGLGQALVLVAWGALLGGIGSAVAMRRVSEWR